MAINGYKVLKPLDTFIFSGVGVAMEFLKVQVLFSMVEVLFGSSMLFPVAAKGD